MRADPRTADLERRDATPGALEPPSGIAGHVVGCVLGARLGAGALPPEWVRDVERSEELRALALLAAR